eukprot:COSAG06_NODE_19795_length_822_cov_1.170124_1_plen_61_part_10
MEAQHKGSALLLTSMLAIAAPSRWTSWNANAPIILISDWAATESPAGHQTARLTSTCGFYT